MTKIVSVQWTVDSKAELQKKKKKYTRHFPDISNGFVSDSAVQVRGFLGRDIRKVVRQNA